MSARDGMLGRALSNAAASDAGPRGLVGADHPDTAVAAAVAIGAHLSKRQAVVLTALLRAGAHGATAAELEAKTGLPGNTIRPRLVELTGQRADMPTLVAEPLVVRTDTKRKTYAGKAARVYRLTEAGERAARELADP